MAQVDFYVLNSNNLHIRRKLICKLCEKAYRRGHRILIRTESAVEDKVLDDLLWTFRAGSFIPHETEFDDSREPLAPILISHHQRPNCFDDILINLGRDIPDNHNNFKRIIEVVDENEETKMAGRQHYRHYKHQGFTVETHRLDAMNLS